MPYPVEFTEDEIPGFMSHDECGEQTVSGVDELGMETSAHDNSTLPTSHLQQDYIVCIEHQEPLSFLRSNSDENCDPVVDAECKLPSL